MKIDPSLNADDSVKYWNEAWLDELIEEAFRLAGTKAAKTHDQK
jgi:endo-alpha-1,4-polygalactosaminidase (GH114 family)